MSSIINSYWPEIHKVGFPESENFIKALIERNPSLGVFSKSDNELRAWITINEFNVLSNLQTVDKYQKKGYATLLVKEMAKKRAIQGKDTVAGILQENTASINLFKKLGFVKIQHQRCVLLDRVDSHLY